MSSTYYDSQLTGAEIDAALNAVSGLIVPANNGKIIAVADGTLVAKSVTEYQLTNLGSKTITESGTYYPADDDLDGYNEVIVNVSGGGSLTPVVITPTVNNGSYIDQSGRFHIGNATYPNYRTISIDLSQYINNLIYIKNNSGDRNYYGILSLLSENQSVTVFGGRQTAANGELVIFVDNNLTNKGYLVYDYTTNAQNAPTVTAYAISL